MVSALILVVFSGLILGFKYSLELILTSRARLSALSVATDRMEYIRSLSYDDAGTVGGIPAGSIPQTQVISLNGIDFTERILIEYQDDPADDLAPTDLIPTDYKAIQISYEWTVNGKTYSTSLSSNIVPRSLETSAGGGSIRVRVYDAGANPIAGAEVRLVNNYATTTVDTVRTTNSNGEALFLGAAAGSEYELSVTKAGYSTDGTYRADAKVVTPYSAPFPVLEGDVVALNYFIDKLSDLHVATYSSITDASVAVDMNDSSQVVASDQVVLNGGQWQLAEISPGVFADSGQIMYQLPTPAPLAAWQNLTLSKNLIPGTNLRYRIYQGYASPVLVPDTDLPGNSLGYVSDAIDISGLNPVTYNELVLGVDFETSDSTITPQLLGVKNNYWSEATVLPNVSFALDSMKIIGQDGDGADVSKNSYAMNTAGNGKALLSDIEWDSYNFVNAGYDVISACTGDPVSVAPGTEDNLTLVLQPKIPNSLRVVVKNNEQQPIAGVAVSLSGSGVTKNLESDFCGQAFFPGLTKDGNYTVTVDYEGVTQTVDVIGGQTAATVIF